MKDIYSQITPVIIVKNGAPFVKNTLNSLTLFKQVVIYDNGSTDDTVALLAAYPNVTLIRGEFLGFGATKNLAANHANTDWVLSLDIDESVSSALLNSLKEWPLQDVTQVGEVLRNNYFCGRHIRTNGWGSDWLCRLYNRQQHQFTDSAVHEKLQLTANTKVKRLKGSLQHEAIIDIAQMLNKTQQYSELYAQSSKARLYPFPIIILKSLFGFLRSYLIKGGAFSGSRGCIIAVGEALGVFFKYSKVYQRSRLKN